MAGKNNQKPLKLKKLNKNQTAMIESILSIHADHLIELMAETMAVLETRVEISSVLGEDREAVYYNGALEQTKIYINMVINSVNQVEQWCRVEDDEFRKARKKRIKRVPVKSENSGVYLMVKRSKG